MKFLYISFTSAALFLTPFLPQLEIQSICNKSSDIRGGRVMGDLWLAGILGGLLLAYLTYVLLKPEEF